MHYMLYFKLQKLQLYGIAGKPPYRHRAKRNKFNVF